MKWDTFDDTVFETKVNEDKFDEITSQIHAIVP